MRIKVVFLPVLAVILFVLTSCWNYREVNEMAIIIGAAVDKGVENQYMLTVELLDVSGGAQTELSTRILSVEGETVFDAARKLISVEGKRGYWGHTRVLIVNEEIAREDITEAVSFFRQDAEARGDLYVIVSRGYSAREIMNSGIPYGDVLSESLAQGLENSKFVSEIPETRLYTLSQDLKSSKVSPVLPAVTLLSIDDKKVPVLRGAAVFQKSRMVGFLDEEETKAMLFLKNEIEGGVLVTKAGKTRVSLEIKDNNTKIKVKTEGDRLILDITVQTKAIIDEVIGNLEFSDIEMLDEIKRLSEEQLKSKLEKIIDKARYYRTDIFGFGQKIYEDNPGKWNEISDDYETEFAKIDVNLTVKVEIPNTSIIFKHLDEGE
ncbi:MAG TPA: Ger(x)C family spore germination protein [Thermoclostridium sp.]